MRYIPFLARRPRRVAQAALAAAVFGLVVHGCNSSPVDSPAPGSVVEPAGSASASLGVVPPPMARGIDALLDSWSAAWNAADGGAYGAHYAVDADVVNPLGAVFTGRASIAATHTFILNPPVGPFRGTTTSYVIRRVVALTGNLALVDATVTVTGFAEDAMLPPGLVQWQEGVVKTRHHMVVGSRPGGWEILAQQITAMQPGIPD